MTSLDLSSTINVSLAGKIALVTGASSGIGLATAKLLAARGAQVANLDVQPPPAGDSHPQIEYVKCDQSSWIELLSAFRRFHQIDIVEVNGGISEYRNYFDDDFYEHGELEEPSQGVFEVNLIGSINVCKIALSRMRSQATGGSIIVVSSATALMPEHSLPLYSACKTAVDISLPGMSILLTYSGQMLGLVRALRPVAILDGVTINAVAPAATVTNQLPKDLAAPIIAAGLPVSSSEHVAQAILHSVVGSQEQRVEDYGKDVPDTDGQNRWNGRTILILGDTWTEIEKPLVACRHQWFGAENERLTRAQQSMTDSRAPTHGK